MAAVADLRVQITQSILGAGLIERAFEGITSAIGKAVEIGVDYNAMLQRTESAYKQLFGSTDAARAKLAEFQRFAAKTPFELPGVLDMGRALASAKVSADNLVPTMRTLGAAISSTGNFSQEQVKGVTTAVTQMLAKGKVSAEEINQLAERGIFGWDLLAEHFGTSTAEIMKAAEKGKISGKDFVDALSKAASDRGWVNLLEDSAQTFDGAMSTLRDAAQMAIAEGFKPLFEEGTKYLGKLATFVQGVDFRAATAGIAAGVRTFVDIIEEDLGPALDELAGVGGLGSALETLGTKFLDFFRGLNFVVRSIGTIFSNVKGVVGGFAGLVGASFESAGVSIATFAHGVGAAMGFLGDILGAGGRAVEAFAAGWAENFAGMLDLAGTLGEVLRAVFEGRIGDIGDIIGRGFERAMVRGERAGDFFGMIPAVFANIGDAAENYGDRLEAIGATSEAMMRGIRERGMASGREWAEASKRIMDGFGEAAAAADRDADRIAAAFKAAGDKVRAEGEQADALGGKYNAMGGKAEEAADKAEQGAKDATEATKGLGAALRDVGAAAAAAGDDFAKLWDEYVRGARVGGLTQAEMQDRLARMGALQGGGGLVGDELSRWRAAGMPDLNEMFNNYTGWTDEMFAAFQEATRIERARGGLVSPGIAAVAGVAPAGYQLIFNGSVTFPLPGANDTVPAWYLKIVEQVRAEQAAQTAGRR